MAKIGIKHVDITSIHPNPANPRKIEDAVEPVARSIEEFGFLVPIVLNDDNVVLSGHARLEAAKRLGMDKVPTVCVKNLSKEQQTAFMLADNRLSENASYNTEQLANLLKELDEAEYDILQTGFKREEVEAFITSATSELDDILGLGDEEDAAPEIDDLDDDENNDVRHMHKLMFVLRPDQKEVVMSKIEEIKKESPEKITNGEALTILCSMEVTI
jgi:ParB/RepB/Spo0J family partition protein